MLAARDRQASVLGSHAAVITSTLQTSVESRHRKDMKSVKPLTAHPSAPMSGEVAVPGDKSISHRALMLGGLAVGETRISGQLEGEDVLNTARAVEAMGADVSRGNDGIWRIHGVGVGGLGEPDRALDLGNAGTAVRLLMGIAATHPFTTHFTGDASLRSRPMGRVVEPLKRMGADFLFRHGCRLPLTVAGSEDPMPISYRLPVPSAQVKSAVLLAALNAPGETTVIEPTFTRDHTERLLRHFGADIRVKTLDEREQAITVTGQPELTGCAVSIPGDPSSAAFFIVAAVVVPGSSLTLRDVCTNETRSGLLTTLLEMGADIETLNQRMVGGEPVADLRVRASSLDGVEIPPERAPAMIDEYPVLAAAAACARGKTVMRGVSELRVKESNRMTAIAEGLATCGVDVEEVGDDLVVSGHGGPPLGGGQVASRLDHRIAMTFLILGTASRQPVSIDDSTPISTSFPGFVDLLKRLGARID